MKLSIITINFNNYIGLKKTLDSILIQSNRDFEWIVIDGASNDGSRDLLEQYSDQITYWCSEQDRGIYNAMNKGTQKAKGDYCLFLNSGDVLCDSRAIERVLTTDFKADIVSFDIYIDGCSCTKLKKSVDSVNAFWIYENTLYHQSTWIKRDELIKCPYREEYKTISDWAFFFEAIAINECSYQHVPLAISIFYSGGISSKPFSPGNTDRTDFLKNYFPVRFITDVRLDPVYRISVNVYRMTSFGQKVVMNMYKIIEYLDFRFLKPLEKIFYK